MNIYRDLWDCYSLMVLLSKLVEAGKCHQKMALTTTQYK